mmetsp:Transcript_10331/g.23088  ORF Transcript_10331/g.23088 Transcript_10331/m.23088 type:complete len:93 (+) Transcript_10331:7788-8066(+)
MLCWWAERTGATFHDRRSKSSPGGTSGVHILNTWFYETLSGTIDGRVTKQYSFEEVKKWTKKWTREDFKRLNKILVPIHEPGHWCVTPCFLF